MKENPNVCAHCSSLCPGFFWRHACGAFTQSLPKHRSGYLRRTSLIFRAPLQVAIISPNILVSLVAERYVGRFSHSSALLTRSLGSNCKRGGFVCEGYSGKVSWQKPPGKSGNTMTGAPITIQSKSEQQPDSASASPTPVHSHPVSMPQSARSTTASTHRDDRYGNSSQQRPVNFDEQSKPGSDGDSVSPSSRQLTYTANQNGPPLHEAYSSVPHGGPPNPPHTQTVTTPVGGRRVSFSQAALSAASGSIPRQRSEKEKMINSELYHANAPELVQERQACKAACWRYNNAAANPTLGISDVEKGRLLQEVLRPGRNWEAVNTGSVPGAAGGHTYVSEGGYPSDIVDVVVDAPFTCSYGYNIRLGKNVYIEFGCTILDSCSVGCAQPAVEYVRLIFPRSQSRRVPSSHQMSVSTRPHIPSTHGNVTARKALKWPSLCLSRKTAGWAAM